MQLTAAITRETNPQKEKVILAAGPCSPVLSYPVVPHRNDIYFPFCSVVFSQNVEVHKRIDFFFLSFLEILHFSSTVLKLLRIYLGFKFFSPKTWKFKLKRDFEWGEGGSFFFGKSQFSAGRMKKKKRTKAESWSKQMLLMKRLSGQTPYFPGK